VSSGGREFVCRSTDDETDAEIRSVGVRRRMLTGDSTHRRSHEYRNVNVETPRADADSTSRPHDRDEMEQLVGVVRRLTEQVDGLTTGMGEASHTASQNISIDQLVSKMQTLIEKVEKRKRSKKHKPSATLEQPSDSNSDGEESVPKRHLIRPMKFDGSGSFETFLAHFQNSASHNEWSNTEQLAWLKASLVREAGQALWDSSPESTNTLEKLIELLKNRFGGTRQTDKYRMEVRLRRRKPNKSLSALHQDIRRLMALAHPDVPASHEK
jgi:hypothetical protein